jgi:hypothetical protein
MALGIVAAGAVAGMANYFLNDLSGTPLFARADISLPVADDQAFADADEPAPLPSGEDTWIAASEDPPANDIVEASAEELPPPEPSTAAPPSDRLAALLDAPQTSESVVPPAILKQVSMFRAPRSPSADIAQPPQADDSARIALLVDDVRLPRSRPDEPVYTGSINRLAGAQQVADRKSAKPSRWRRFGPCAALRGLRVAYLFGNRCGAYTHYDPPPPRKNLRPARQEARIVAASPAAAQYSPHAYQPPRVMQD